MVHSREVKAPLMWLFKGTHLNAVSGTRFRTRNKSPGVLPERTSVVTKPSFYFKERRSD